ncbi:hypothetical protein C7212DRAFT_278972 [Tuber magnatum]|uniref:Azaphilone pigments biosynthesis cluster protein L N-terminal domain-containing protein n=1 Tax=Tuber magnatum TaxID=42249 RepID=A0A317SRN7_9PEZI|nr:hypothetical protein C7212DRAFT_278972 [Tuber magnatum]
MDPLSVVSGIAGTVAVGTKVLVALHGFAKGVKSAPEELKLLTRELEDLCRIMDNFRKKTRGQMVNRDIEDSSAAILDIFMQLNQLITEHTASEKDGFLKKGWKQVKWHYIEKEIADLRAHLNSNKGNLLVALTLANELQNGHSNMKLERVQGALEEVIERLQDHDMQTVATCESFTLQRWQDVPSAIASSSRPATPNGQASAARSESGILSEAGFSERSIPMSAYQFNDMGNRGKGILISDGRQTKAYTVTAGIKKKASNSKPPETGVSRAGSPASSPKPRTKSLKSTPLASVPEPAGEDETQGVKDDSGPKEAGAVNRDPVTIPSKKTSTKPRGSLRRVRHRLKNFREMGISKTPGEVPEDPENDPLLTIKVPQTTWEENNSVIGIARAPPLQRPRAPRQPSNVAVEKFLRGLKAPPDPASKSQFEGPGGRQKLISRCHAIWPPYQEGGTNNISHLIAGKKNDNDPVFLESIQGAIWSRDDGYQLQPDQRVRLIGYTGEGWFYGQVFPEGLIVQLRRADLRLAATPLKREIQEVAQQQVLALLRPGGFEERSEDRLGIGGSSAHKPSFGGALVPPSGMMQVISANRKS